MWGQPVPRRDLGRGCTGAKPWRKKGGHPGEGRSLNPLSIPELPIHTPPRGVLLPLAAGGGTTAAPPTGAPAELKIGFVDFLSGPAVLFGASGKNTAEWLVDKWNKEGGIKGVKVKLVIVDEAGGPDKQVTE